MKRRAPIKRKKRVSKRPKAPRKRLKAECDRLFSRFIRLRDGVCRLCNSTAYLQCAHLFSRRYYGTRWSPVNAWALCRACHVRYTYRPLEWDEVLRETLGELYEPTRTRALFEGMPDLEATKRDLQYLVARYEKLSGSC